MLISFSQALLITELITGSFRILSCDTACQQERNLSLKVVQVRRKKWLCVAHRRPGGAHTHIYRVAQKMYTLFFHQYLWNKFK